MRRQIVPYPSHAPFVQQGSKGKARATLNPVPAPEHPQWKDLEGGKTAVYKIRVKGHLEGHWSEWFDGLVISNLKNGEAVLSGEIVDQAALHGVLIKVRDLSLPLLAVSRVDSVQGTPGGGENS